MLIVSIIFETFKGPNNFTHVFQAGVYDIILDGAAGGKGCHNGIINSEGGNGARFRCKIRFKKIHLLILLSVKHLRIIIAL